jgi:hypothetical protein
VAAVTAGIDAAADGNAAAVGASNVCVMQAVSADAGPAAGIAAVCVAGASTGASQPKNDLPIPADDSSSDDVILIDVDPVEAAAADTRATAAAAGGGGAAPAAKRHKVDLIQQQQQQRQRAVAQGVGQAPSGVSPGYLCALACLGIDVRALLAKC